MLVWQFSSFGVDSLEFVERPTPEPGPGEVLVKMRAISFNYRDLLMVKGLYNPKLKLPTHSLFRRRGRSGGRGRRRDRWKPGDRVAGFSCRTGWTAASRRQSPWRSRRGHRRHAGRPYVLLKESGLVAMPEHLSFQEAATLPCAGVTAWNALAAGNLKPGDTVLDPGNRRRLHLCCNYRENPEWDRWVMKETDGDGVDLIVEVGGEGTLARSLRSIRMGGTIAQVGFASGLSYHPRRRPPPIRLKIRTMTAATIKRWIRPPAI
jgi:NADPH:quinone reductase-like Zn-dependent oxidoreductase